MTWQGSLSSTSRAICFWTWLTGESGYGALRTSGIRGMRSARLQGKCTQACLGYLQPDNRVSRNPRTAWPDSDFSKAKNIFERNYCLDCTREKFHSATGWQTGFRINKDQMNKPTNQRDPFVCH